MSLIRQYRTAQRQDPQIRKCVEDLQRLGVPALDKAVKAALLPLNVAPTIREIVSRLLAVGLHHVAASGIERRTPYS